MKKVTTIFIVLLLFSGTVFSQRETCLPEGITFYYQYEIDNFQENYPNCTEIEGDLTIQGGNMINSLSGLDVLTSIGGNLRVYTCGGLIDNLSGLNNLTSIGGSLIIEYNYDLSSLDDLTNLTCIGENLEIVNNDALTNLSGLDNIQESFPGNIIICENDAMNDLTGLDHLTTIGGSLEIGEHWLNGKGNLKLNSLTGLDNLLAINGDLIIAHNDSLVTLSGIESLTTIGGTLCIFKNYNLNNLEGLSGVNYIGEDIQFCSNNFTNLAGLENISHIPGSLRIGIDSDLGGVIGNPALDNLHGLDNLISIGEDLIIYDNQALESLSGLENLTSIGRDLIIGGFNYIAGCCKGNPVLTDLSVLQNLTTLNGSLDIYCCDSLTSLTGLENINANSLSGFSVYYNPQLSHCAVQSICDYISLPSGLVNFHDNASGCNSQEEVEEACETVGEEELQAASYKLQVYPCPFSDYLNLCFTAYRSQSSVIELYSVSGQKIKQLLNEEMMPGKYEFEFDIRGLPAGVYFCTLQTDDTMEKVKIVKY